MTGASLIGVQQQLALIGYATLIIFLTGRGAGGAFGVRPYAIDSRWRGDGATADDLRLDGLSLAGVHSRVDNLIRAKIYSSGLVASFPYQHIPIP